MSERKRYRHECFSGHECSSEEVGLVLEELRCVMSDEDIVVHDDPMIDDLEHIIFVAESYSGGWYHSRVSVREHAFVSVLHSRLQRRVVELGADYGIFLSYVLAVSDEAEVALNGLLDSAFDGEPV